MFDKYKERYAKFEADHEAARKVRLHVEKNKMAYTVGTSSAGCLIVGGVLGTKFGKKVDVTAVAKNTALVNWNPSASVVQETIINMPAKADRGHIIVDAITGTPIAASIRETARIEGIPRTALRDNLRGLTEFAPNGKRYIDLGENLSEQVKITLG